MTAIDTTVTTPAADITVAATAPVAKAPKAPKAVKPVVVKAPSKTSLAAVIFAAAMADRAAGVYATNKAFRAAVLTKIETDLSVSTASAATMFNACKIKAEAAAAAEGTTVGLGRDPKVVKVKVEGAKRGRPAKAKADAEVAPAATEPTVIVVTEPATEAAPAEAVAA